jgi:glutamyl-tRNA synthetase
MSDVVTRFAPSPTGRLHIGGARTALFNWLFARHNNGKFLLRIEDTDRERSRQEFEDAIIRDLQWLGLDWDEGPGLGGPYGPYRQTERGPRYKEQLKRLLASGHAYPCFCSHKELESEREAVQAAGKPYRYSGKCRDLTAEQTAALKKEGRAYSIRLKVTEGKTEFHDLIRGDVTVDHAELDDFILVRSGGEPTYNFVAVVDDALMEITHVIRGEDHLSNTPRQIQLYQAFDYPVPRFGHLPMILGPDKSKLSKRHGAVSSVEYREMGFLWEGMTNYLARLGWSHGDQELFTPDELAEKFDLDHVNKAPAVFDVEKLLWVNAHHLRTLEPSDVARRLIPHLEKRGLLGPGTPELDPSWLVAAVLTLRERSRTLEEMAEMGAFYFRELAYDTAADAKFLVPDTLPHLTAILDRLTAAVAGWSHQALHDAVQAYLDANGVKLKTVAQPLRIMLTYRTVSPGLFEVMEVLGKERTLARIRKGLEHIKSKC